jgi:hypothetical protein
VLWTRDAEADKRIRRMLNSYVQAQLSGAYAGSLLSFTGMTPGEFELWATRGLVSDRVLRVMRHGNDSGHRGEWLTREQALALPLVASS